MSRLLSLFSIPILLSLLALAVRANSRVSQLDVQELHPGDVVTRELSGGGSYSYSVELPANCFFQVLVQQQGIDVVISLSFNGAELSTVDRPNGSRGRETASLITSNAGSYMLIVKSLENVSAKGRFELHVNKLREATEQDKTWIAAEQTVSKAERQRVKYTASSFRSAIDLFDEAAELWRQLDQPYEEAVALYGSGMSSFSLGNNQAALDYLNRSLQLFGNDPYGQSIAVAAMGWPYMYLGNYEKAEWSFAQAYRHFRSERNLRGQGLTLYGMGWVHALRGEVGKAYEKFSRSLKCRRVAQDRRGEAITLAGIGKLEARRGRHMKAIQALNESLRLLDKRDAYAKADSASNLGWVYATLGNHRAALEYFQRALPMRQAVGDRIGEATTLFGIGVTQRTLGHLKDSLSAIDRAVDLIEKLRVGGTNQQLRISYFASVQEYYEFYISLLMQLHDVDRSAGYAATALHVYERARARGLIDLLTEAQIDLRDGIDATLLEEEHRLDDEINTLGAQRYQLLNRAHSSEEAKKLAQQVADLTVRYDALEARIRSNSPGYSDIVRPQPLTAVEIQQLLDEDTLVLSYALGDDKSYAWAVTSDGVDGFQLAPRSEIERVARETYRSLRLGRDETTIHNGLKELSRMLLQPVTACLHKKRIVVVAEGVLQFVPFAALPAPLTLSPLIADHELLFLPSATTLIALRKQRLTRTEPAKTLTIIADPVYSSGDARLTARVGARERGQEKFPRLLSSLWEAKRISSHVAENERKVFLNFDANRKAIVNGDLAQYRLLHFAAHALIDDQQPQLSGLVLSTVDQRGKPQDGFLRSNAIFKLELSADLVVLSACRTGLGKDFKGEGLVSLTRAFMYAGSQRVMVSLWDVDDRATSELMVRFYDALLGPEKLSPAAALRKAQLDLSKDPRWKSPYYWAPFILQGEW